jgi:ribonuclease HII
MQHFYFNNYEIGIDEAGRGPLIGSVYAAAVIWDDKLCPPDNLIIDSKKLSQKKRKIALEWIKNNIKYYAVGFADHNEIDKINILEATKIAMERAINELKEKIEIKDIIIDGVGWEKKFTNYNIKSIVKGDSKYYSIACASILAKEYHDEHIKNLCGEVPELIEKYDLLNNMGYGTKKHIDGIKKYGYSNYHRKSFVIKK